MKRLQNKKLFLLDMDGTVYLGNHVFAYTLPFLDHITKTGAMYMFLTNNSSKSASLYLDKLAALGIPATADHLITSTHATARYLIGRYGHSPVYASGTKAFVQELTDLGVHVETDSEAPVSALVMGFDTELTFQKLEIMCVLLGKELDYIATNPDWVCPTEYGFVPDCGSVAQMLKHATGREPVFIGKPKPTMVEMALLQAGVGKEETIVIGDRLYTDIACGIAAGVDAALVLSGESTEKDLENSPFQPDYVFRDLGQLLEIMQNAKAKADI